MADIIKFNPFTSNFDLTANPMTTLGDIPYGTTNGVPTRLPGNTITTQKFLSQTGTGSASQAPSWQPIPAQGTLTYYLQNTASAVSTYKKLLTVPYPPKTQLDFTPANGTHVLQNWITEASFPNLTFIPAGGYEFHIHAKRTSGAFTVYAEFWETDASGVDIGLIGTSDSSTTTTSEVEYRLFFYNLNTYTMTSAASRIAVRVYAVTTGSPMTATLWVGGTADSHITLPSNTVDATNFVPYTGATADVNLNNHNLVNVAFLGIGISVPTSPLHLMYANSSALTDVLVNPGTKTIGNLIDLQVNGNSKFKVDSTGSGTFYNPVTISHGYSNNIYLGALTLPGGNYYNPAIDMNGVGISNSGYGIRVGWNSGWSIVFDSVYGVYVDGFSDGFHLNSYSGSVTNPPYSFQGDLITGIYHPSGSTIGFTIAGSEKMRLDSTGLGIGKTASYPLDVSGDINTSGAFKVNGSPIVQSQWTTNGSDIYYNTGKIGVGVTVPSANIHSLSTGEQLRLGYDASNYVSFQTDSSGRLNLTSNTNLFGFNNSNPNYTVDVSGSINATGQIRFSGANSTSTLYAGTTFTAPSNIVGIYTPTQVIGLGITFITDTNEYILISTPLGDRKIMLLPV